MLKGGVPVALGATLNLADLDLLVAPRHPRRVAALLERSEGMVVSGTDPRVGGRGMTHLAPRVATGDIPVEVHFDLHYVPDPDAARDRAVHLADFAALRMLTPAEHLQHVVVHSALQHPERRGSLRDLAVIRHAIAMCTEGELRAAHGGLSRGEATAVLEFVLELTSGRVPVDPFRRTAAVGYLIAARFRDRSPVTLRHLAASAVALAESPRAYLQLLRASVDPWELESSVAWVAALGRRMPRLGRAVRIAGALGRLALVALPAARVAWSARRLAGKE